MRNVDKMWDIWRSGVYVGDSKPSTRVTVEKGWTLKATEATVGTWSRGPARYYQGPAHIETEVPNVLTVQIQRGVDMDAGTCSISVQNVNPTRYGQVEPSPGQYGDLGHYTWDHGRSQDAKARWGHMVNQWADVLVPNALIRTYQGFGGTDKTIDQALADEDIILNGVWLVDDVSISTQGTIELRCRDLGKLLLDQQLFPPLVPRPLYPLTYKRWILVPFKMPVEPPPRGSMCFPAIYATSSTDVVYGEHNTKVTGHPPSDAFDISFETGPDIPGAYAHQWSYWLSEPMPSPDDQVWVEFSSEAPPTATVGQVYLHPWAGHYRVMVSVHENGEWVEGPEGGRTAEGIPYVAAPVCGWEGDQRPGNTNLYDLPRDYQAAKLRLTCTNLVRTPEGPAYEGVPTDGYRCGFRKVMACFNSEAASYATLVFAGASIPVNNSNRLGYWQVRSDGRVFAFGDARVYDPNSPATTPSGTVLAMTAHPTGDGYWTLDATGRVISAGQAHWQNDIYPLANRDAVDIAPTPSGNGYWLLQKNGKVSAFGDATWLGDDFPSGTMPSGGPLISRSIESHPTGMGYWVLRSDGTVVAFGTATHLGNANRTGFTLAEYTASIRRTSTGAGYWITSGGGRVQAFGDAPHLGNANLDAYKNEKWFKGLTWDLIPTAENDKGYAIQTADGRLQSFGDRTGLGFGSVGEGEGRQRFPGNYRDYADIIKELALWSGFYLWQDPQPINEFPFVYGNIENTGAWADADLPVTMFDKRPVIEAIKEIRDILGYIVYVDAEGGFRFESPSWWTVGNYLMDGITPYGHMPEIDEVVQLTGHQMTFSGDQARSQLIIAPENPMPTAPGIEAIAANVAKATIIRPKTADDLRGLLVPAMWVQGEFLDEKERQTMAELIDMKMWFSRRTAQVTCVGIPLIDINDQVRVIERQSGEVYVHYVKGVSLNHDLTSGDFTMTLTTHWLGGTPYGTANLYLTAEGRPQGDGYWQATITGGIYAFGGAQLYDSHQDDTHLEWVVSFRSTHSGKGYYTLDLSGKVLTYGDAVHRGELAHPTNDVTDFALTPTGNGYWILSTDGGVHPFGDAVFYGQPTITGKMPSGSLNLAQSIESHPITQGYWVLASDGTVAAFNLTHYGDADRDGYTTAEYTSSLRRTPTGNGYWIPSGGGIVQAKGDAVHLGNGERYPADNLINGLVWDMIVHPSGGYALQHADGHLDRFNYPSSGEGGATETQIAWALVSPEAAAELPDPSIVYVVTPQVREFLVGTSSPSANNAAASNFGAPTEPTIKALTT